MKEVDEFKAAVRALHRQKNAAYGNSWKKRGELMSIMANIARKVDRLEVLGAGGPSSRDESHIDTAIDLLVYCLKFVAYLADHHPTVRQAYFGDLLSTRSFSDGTEGVELLLDQLDLSGFDTPGVEPGKAAQDVISQFERLEACYAETGPVVPGEDRAVIVQALALSAAQLVGALRTAQPLSYADFVTVWRP